MAEQTVFDSTRGTKRPKGVVLRTAVVGSAFPQGAILSLSRCLTHPASCHSEAQGLMAQIGGYAPIADGRSPLVQAICLQSVLRSANSWTPSTNGSQRLASVQQPSDSRVFGVRISKMSCDIVASTLRFQDNSGTLAVLDLRSCGS